MSWKDILKMKGEEPPEIDLLRAEAVPELISLLEDFEYGQTMYELLDDDVWFPDVKPVINKLKATTTPASDYKVAAQVSQIAEDLMHYYRGHHNGPQILSTAKEILEVSDEWYKVASRYAPLGLPGVDYDEKDYPGW
mgnify:FL=1